MREVFTFNDTDEEGRKIVRLGGDCPECGRKADMKFSACGKVVMYHLPTSCVQHARRHNANARKSRPGTEPPTPYKEAP